MLSVSEKVGENGVLQNILASHLDRASHPVIKNWEALASTKEVDAPLEVRLKCKLNGQNSCTQMLLDLLASDENYKDKKVRDLMTGLTKIHPRARKLIEESAAYQGKLLRCSWEI